MKFKKADGTIVEPNLQYYGVGQWWLFDDVYAIQHEDLSAAIKIHSDIFTKFVKVELVESWGVMTCTGSGREYHLFLNDGVIDHVDSEGDVRPALEVLALCGSPELKDALTILIAQISKPYQVSPILTKPYQNLRRTDES